MGLSAVSFISRVAPLTFFHSANTSGAPCVCQALPALGAFFLRCSLSQVRFILASGMCRQSTCGNTWGSSSVQPAHLAFGVLTVPRLFRPFSPLPVLLCLGEGPLPGPEGGLVPSTGK